MTAPRGQARAHAPRAAATAPSLMLGDLLDAQELGLELLTGGTDARQRPVTAVHDAETPSPSRWVGRDWLMLTAGERESSRRAQRQLVAELAEAGVAALGFARGPAHPRVPATLLSEARTRELPVFAIPAETSLHQIAAFVNRWLVSGELRTLERLAAMQRYLMDALHEDVPQQTLVERLATLLDATVLLLGRYGEVEAATGAAPAAAIHAALSAGPVASQTLTVDGWNVVAAPIARPHRANTRWLAATSQRRTLRNPITQPAIEAAAPLLAAMARVRDAARAEERALRHALLDDALDVDAAHDLGALAAKASAFGLDFAGSARVVVLGHATDHLVHAADRDRALADDLEGALDELGAPHLVAVRAGMVVGLVQAERAELRAALDQLVERQPDVVVGLGRDIARIADAVQSLRDAELAARQLAHQPGCRLLEVEDLDLCSFVLGELSAERLESKVDATLAPLRDHPNLRRSLVAYFEHDLDVVAAARSLHLHPNSVRYRLARVEDLLGQPLKRVSVLSALHLAMLADRRRAGGG